MGKKLVIFTDIGDTIIDEGTEERDERGVVLRASCIPTARETYLALKEAGYAIVMVADGMTESFHRLMDQHELSPIFSAWIISEEVGEDKPSPKMFQAAMEALGLTEADRERVIMVGNNVIRDMRGANRFGIRSVLLDWSGRRSFEPELPEDVPAWRIHLPADRLPLAEEINATLEAGERS